MSAPRSTTMHHPHVTLAFTSPNVQHKKFTQQNWTTERSKLEVIGRNCSLKKNTVQIDRRANTITFNTWAGSFEKLTLMRRSDRRKSENFMFENNLRHRLLTLAAMVPFTSKTTTMQRRTSWDLWDLNLLLSWSAKLTLHKQLPVFPHHTYRHSSVLKIALKSKVQTPKCVTSCDRTLLQACNSLFKCFMPSFPRDLHRKVVNSSQKLRF